MKFKIWWSAGNQLGEDEEVREFKSEADAEDYAYEQAKESYESYLGLHGIRDAEDIVADGEADDEDEAWEVIKNEMESSIDFRVKEIKDDKEKQEIKKNAGV